jgi:LmbE family N-acetylglucosaminyl deacetylase
VKTASPDCAVKKIAMAIAAHPDDIEFGMAGTLLLLKERGWEIHYMNLSSGNCGSKSLSAARTRRIRSAEAKAAAAVIGTVYHPGFCDDLEIFYELKTLRRLAAVIRETEPSILFTHSPEDYMEDHMNTCRLAVTAAFARGMPNFKTLPPRAAREGEMAIYHSMPHGLRDPLGRLVEPEFFVNTGGVHKTKRRALAEHRSQKDWLDATQGMDSYLRVMDDYARELGRSSGKFRFAEGWRRRLHLGFSATAWDPLREALKGLIVLNKKYGKRPE